MKRRILAAAIAAMMLAGSLTGCGGDSPAPAPDAGSAAPGAPAEEGAQAPVKIVVYNNSGSIAGAGSEAGADPAIMEQIHQWMLENTGYDVQVIVPPAGNETEKLNLLLAGGDQVDLFWGDWSEYASKKVIVPINSYLDGKGQDIVKAWPEEAWKAMTDKEGNIYGVPRSTPNLGNPTWIRTDWLEKENLEMPKTIDELDNVLRTFKENGTGGEGTIPLLADIAGKHSSKGLHNSFLGAFTEYGYSNWLDPTDNKIKPAELQPGFKDFLAKMNEWYTKGYMYPEFASLSKDKIREIVKQGKVGSAAVWYSNITLSLYDLQKTFPEANYDYQHDGLEGPSGKAETAMPASTTGALISAKCEHPEAVIDMLNFIYSDPANHMVTWYGPEGMFWKWKDKDAHIYETIGEKTGYYAEYAFAIGLPMETAVSGDNPQQARHQEYLTNEHTDLKRGKIPFDSGIVYDPAVIKSRVPGASDISRMLEEETINFIMGTRPIEEYDQFVQELYDAGMQDWIDAYTEMYFEQVK